MNEYFKESELDQKLKLTIEECESLAHKIWYLKFEDRCKRMLEEHTKKIQDEFSLLRKYKSEIYNQFEYLKTMMKECKNSASSIHSELGKMYDFRKEVKERYDE